ncbi:hypothetical protein [Rubrivirga sp. IMCC43871]|uniref:hypothetical protein n=1 Tax=Rubrivirga sp. IMCC43871 TaxID=3391575 RepID=UPI00398FDACE
MADKPKTLSMTVPFGAGPGVPDVRVEISMPDPPDDECTVVRARATWTAEDGSAQEAVSTFFAYRFVERIQTAVAPPVYAQAAPPALQDALEASSFPVLRCAVDSRRYLRLVVGDNAYDWRDVWVVRLKHQPVEVRVAVMPRDRLPEELAYLDGDLLVHVRGLSGKKNHDSVEWPVPPLLYGLPASEVLAWNEAAFTAADGVWDERPPLLARAPFQPVQRHGGLPS